MSMTGIKSKWKSRAFWGAILAVAGPVIGGVSGFEVDPISGDFSGNIYALSGMVTGGVGGAIAGWGRLVATTKLF